MRRTSITLIAAVLGVLGFSLAPSLPAADATTNPYQRGPAPSSARIDAAHGPFATGGFTVADPATPGFGAATIFYPTSTAEGTFGGIAIAPGLTETQPAIRWLGPRLASHGFVVITFDTNSIFDSSASRGTQLLAALDYLTRSSAVHSRVDHSRLAVMGHSMGGGGALEAAKARPSIRAAIPLAAWSADHTWPEIQTPTLIIAAQYDRTAPPSSHSKPFYQSMPATLPKAYLEIAGAGHYVTNNPDTTTARYSISWLKRFVDNDTRYQQFLCPPPTVGGVLSAYQSTCPYL